MAELRRGYSIQKRDLRKERGKGEGREGREGRDGREGTGERGERGEWDILTLCQAASSHLQPQPPPSLFMSPHK